MQDLNIADAGFSYIFNCIGYYYEGNIYFLLYTEYLYLQLYSYDLRKVFYSMGDGLRQTLSYNDVKDMPVYLPSPKEQAQIVSFSGLTPSTAVLSTDVRFVTAESSPLMESLE